MPGETLKRIWRESRFESISDGSVVFGFRAIVVADRGVTVDGDTVLRLEKTIQHWHHLADEPCDGKDCRFGPGYQEVIADPNKLTEQESIRIAIRHADELFERFAEETTEARLIVDPPLPEPMPEAAHG